MSHTNQGVPSRAALSGQGRAYPGIIVVVEVFKKSLQAERAVQPGDAERTRAAQTTHFF